MFGFAPSYASDSKYVDLSSQNITKIENLSAIRNVIQLDLSDNNIQDLTPLLELNDLKSLNLSGNQLSDISALANMKELELLVLSKNNIQDFSPLAALPNLKSLFISTNPGVKTQEQREKVLKLFSSQTYIMFEPQTETNLDGVGARGKKVQ